MIRRTFCPEDGRACYTPKGDEPIGFRCANYSLCKSFELPALGMPSEGPRRECGSGASAPASPVPSGMRPESEES